MSKHCVWGSENGGCVRSDHRQFEVNHRDGFTRSYPTAPKERSCQSLKITSPWPFNSPSIMY